VKVAGVAMVQEWGQTVRENGTHEIGTEMKKKHQKHPRHYQL